MMSDGFLERKRMHLNLVHVLFFFLGGGVDIESVMIEPNTSSLGGESFTPIGLEHVAVP